METNRWKLWIQVCRYSLESDCTISDIGIIIRCSTFVSSPPLPFVNSLPSQLSPPLDLALPMIIHTYLIKQSDLSVMSLPFHNNPFTTGMIVILKWGRSLLECSSRDLDQILKSTSCVWVWSKPSARIVLCGFVARLEFKTGPWVYSLPQRSCCLFPWLSWKPII